MRARSRLLVALTSTAASCHAAPALNGRLDTQTAGVDSLRAPRSSGSSARRPSRRGSATACRRMPAASGGCAATATPGSPTASSSATAASPPAASSRRRATRTCRPAGAETRDRSGSKDRSTMVVLYRVEEKAVQQDPHLLAGLRARRRRPHDPLARRRERRRLGRSSCRRSCPAAERKVAQRRHRGARDAQGRRRLHGARCSCARQDASGKVRGDALFWLAQSAGAGSPARSPRRSTTIPTPT